MISIKELRWSNTFSYGLDNKVNFTTSPLIQLVGKNGHGKSSIALILEEVLFNKNSKGIKKADILNRYVTDKTYLIELDFDKDGTEYTIKSKRGATQSVKLYKGSTDISAHTATATYKLISELIGIDHKTFSQIVYQSSAASLEFLTATDSNRKKFLIDLLNLTKYNSASEVFKKVASDLSKSADVLQGKLDTITSWKNKYAKTDLSLKPYAEVPVMPENLATEKAKLQNQLDEIASINKKISQNNKYKELQAAIVLLPKPEAPEVSPEDYKVQHALVKKELESAKAYVTGSKTSGGICPTCKQSIDSCVDEELIESKKQEVIDLTAKLAELKELYNTAKSQQQKVVDAQKATEEWEKYHAVIDPDMDTELLDRADLEEKVSDITAEISDIKTKIATAEKHNKAADAHNSKVETILSQLSEFEEEFQTISEELSKITQELNTVTILNKVFSTSGLVAYKIECLVKDLEDLTNNYLVDLSDGRFQLAFKVSASDKLNVIITDNGVDIDILALSNGERARVNVATLLAIRKLMQSLSSSRINLLILDETIESLDVDGKEKLIEILLKEENLNTFLVSHGFTHPLLEKINVIKERNISRIEA